VQTFRRKEPDPTGQTWLARADWATNTLLSSHEVCGLSVRMMHSHSECRENDYSCYKLPSLSNDFFNSADDENRIHENRMDRGEDGGLTCSVLLGNIGSHLNYGKAQRLSIAG